MSIVAQLLGPAHRSAPSLKPPPPPNLICISEPPASAKGPISAKVLYDRQRRAELRAQTADPIRRVQSSSALLKLTAMPTPGYARRALLEVAVAPPAAEPDRRPRPPRRRELPKNHRRPPIAPPFSGPGPDPPREPIELSLIHI